MIFRSSIINGYAQSAQQDRHNNDIKPENLSSSSDSQLARHNLSAMDQIDVKPNIFNLKNEYPNHSSMHNSKSEYSKPEYQSPSEGGIASYESENYHRSIEDERDQQTSQNCDESNGNSQRRKGGENVVDMIDDDEEDEIEEAENLSLNNNSANTDHSHMDKFN